MFALARIASTATSPVHTGGVVVVVSPLVDGDGGGDGDVGGLGLVPVPAFDGEGEGGV